MGHTNSGVYHVTPNGMRSGIDVYCDMITDGGGWMVCFLSITVIVILVKKYNQSFHSNV